MKNDDENMKNEESILKNEKHDIQESNEKESDSELNNYTFENENDKKNNSFLRKNMKNKTKLGKIILKAIRILFLRIMIKTHPDKVGDEYLNQFKEAKNANENQNIDDLIIIAIEVNSSIENLPIDIDIEILLKALVYKIKIFKNFINENL